MILVLKSSESLEALLEPEVDLWVRCLNDAMQGLGTDENSLSLTRGSARKDAQCFFVGLCQQFAGFCVKGCMCGVIQRVLMEIASNGVALAIAKSGQPWCAPCPSACAWLSFKSTKRPLGRDC